jgi:predicted RNA-binding protein
MSDDDLRTPSGFGRTLHQHSGEQFESGTVHRARGVNDPMPDVGVEAAHDDDGFSGGGANYREDGGRRRKLRDTPASKEIVILGKGKTTIFKGTNAVEDERWVYITEIKENGTKAYLCVRCHKSFTGYDAKVISHCLQLKDGSVAPCTQKPTAEARLVLERAKKEKESKKATGGRVGSASASKDQATARTPPIRAAFGGSVQRVEDCDEALAKWAVAHDIAWAAIDSRDHLWVDFVEKLKLASPVWTVPTREVLSADEKRGGEARAGGLYLALTSKDNEKEKILAAAREEGGTAVSDGAKLATRKRGMLNTALVTRFGVIFLQQTDGTGHVKDGEYLANDYGKALEKAGPYTIVQKWTGGKLVKKKKSSVCKLLFTDRGGGCVTALVLMEDLWIIIADGCKVHLADLLIEDCAKPFKGHLKKVHLLILFIINHTFIYAIFVSYAEVLALLIPADTRFATEIICARSLLRDKAQIKRLFVDPKFDEWTAKQDAPTRATTRKMKTLALDDAFWHVTEVFVAVEEIIETSLRILDSDKPNLIHTAFAFVRIIEEFKEPLLGKLAKIPEWGDIDLGLDLKSEFLGKLPAYLQACVQKRKADWLSDPVRAAACVNPIYSYALEPAELWEFAKTKECERAVAVVIKKWLWGDDDKKSLAEDGLDRYLHGEGIYSAEGELSSLQKKVHDPLAFWRHVARSTLDCDVVFATEIAIPLVCGFANQSASERCNKYMSDSAGDKKRTGLNLEKARKTLDLKVHLLYQKARRKAEAKEQRAGERSVAHDLRSVYVAARERAREEAQVKRRLRELRREAAGDDGDDGDEAAPLVTEADAAEVLEEARVELEALLVVPEGFKICETPPSEEALTFAKPASAASRELENRRILRKWEGFGWMAGTIKSVNENAGRTIARAKVNFFVLYDGEEAHGPVPHVLEACEYQTHEDADYDSWLLLEAAPTAAGTAAAAAAAIAAAIAAAAEGAAADADDAMQE